MGRSELIRPVSAGRVMTAEEAKEDCREKPSPPRKELPSIEQISILLGADLTPKGDLDERLSSSVQYVEEVSEDLGSLYMAVRGLEYAGRKSPKEEKQ